MPSQKRLVAMCSDCELSLLCEVVDQGSKSAFITGNYKNVMFAEYLAAIRVLKCSIEEDHWLDLET